MRFVLLTWEKGRDIEERGKDYIDSLKEKLEKDGIEWRYLRYHKRPPILSTLYDLLVGAVFCLYLIPARGIRIIHARGITPGVIPMLLSGILKAKIIYDMRGLLAEEYVGGGLWREGGLAFRLVKYLEKKMLSRADAVVVLTDKHYALNETLGVRRGRDVPMEVIPCCVDTTIFNQAFPAEGRSDRGDPKKDLGLEGRFVLLYPGKIGTFYFVEEMLDFFKTSLDIIPNGVFLIVTRDEISWLMRKMEEKGIPPDRVMVKSAAYEEMPLFMRSADAGVFFINPYKKIGSSPIKMGEFLASGVPVVINPGVGDTEWLTRDNRVGVVVEKFNTEEYARAARELLELKKDRDGLKRRCRRVAEERLSLEMGVERYLRIYEKLSGEP